MSTAMAPLVTKDSALTPLFAPTPAAVKRVREFFSAQISNDHTRKAYLHVVRTFSAWGESKGLRDLAQIEAIHVAAYVKELERARSAPTAKQHLSALRMLFDWLVTGQILSANPAHAVHGPKHVVKKGKTPVLQPEEARTLLDSIETTSLIGLRDRALIALMTYTFARVNAAVQMKVKDYFTQGRRGWVRLHEKGGKEHEVPCHHNLERFLEEYLAAAKLENQADAPLFQTASGRTGLLTGKRLWQQDAYRMVQRRAKAAGLRTKIGNHTFRATGITAYLMNGGSLEMAQYIAGHESPRTTKLYDRRREEVSLDDVERIAI
jgi:site-specific recombinase XerD